MWWIRPTGLETVEVVYDLDVDSFNAWLGGRVGCFHCRPDHSAHLPQHADHARGRVVISRRREPAHAAGTNGTAGEGQPPHGPGLGGRRRFWRAVAGARRHVYLSGTQRSAVACLAGAPSQAFRPGGAVFSLTAQMQAAACILSTPFHRTLQENSLHFV